ncbi:hypothetical protein [Amycolatopsis sp. SID8362]|uniref:hypothetical protein n=1 Tax=Amycolatopsis sp. SID8362 TaxID=2690346 RepID=UPI00136E2A39|nr:hypothetical protein [Amycolatopsis sp. SID8362]NBH05573.1 hypothetical protein [Amycolatopsis sp. SID8362]NED42273.1 hypothetical protein [Amycolatopsis sp. SID8362]
MSEEDETAGPRLAEEIRLLAELVVEKAAPWLEGVVAAGHGDPDQAKPDGSACGWCPLCAIVAVVRGERPELVARVLEQLAQLVALLRAVLADRWEPDEGVHMPGFRPAPRPPADASVSVRVQHIAVRRRDEWEN